MELMQDKKLKLMNHLWIVIFISMVLHGVILFYPLIKPLSLISSIQSTDQVIQAFLQTAVKQKSKNAKKKVIKTKPVPRKPLKEVSKKTKSIEKTMPKEITRNSATNQQLQSVSKKFDSVISHFVQPNYPRIAIARGLTGIVVLKLSIQGDGQLMKVEIIKSSGHESLDESALHAANSWKFKSFSEEKSKVFTSEKTVVYQINQ